MTSISLYQSEMHITQQNNVVIATVTRCSVCSVSSRRIIVTRWDMKKKLNLKRCIKCLSLFSETKNEYGLNSV